MVAPITDAGMALNIRPTTSINHPAPAFTSSAPGRMRAARVARPNSIA
jgi:hypothetical protein